MIDNKGTAKRCALSITDHQPYIQAPINELGGLGAAARDCSMLPLSSMSQCATPYRSFACV